MSPDAQRDRIAELFSYDPPSAARQKEIRERLLASVQQFARSAQVNSSMAESELASWFHDTRLQRDPGSLKTYADFLDEVVLRHSINMTSPRCLGHMTGALPAFAQIVGDVVVGLNQNLVKREASKVMSLIERQTLGMLHRLVFRQPGDFYHRHIQSPSSTLGIMTSCGTLANLTALWCARNACFPARDGAQSVEEDGLAVALRQHGYERAVILSSSLMHYSIRKAAGVLGLGAQNIIEVRVDENNRMSVPALEDAIASCARRRWRVIAIVAVAGNTECGAVDPLAEIAEVAARHSIHLHVDAAWGGPLLFSARHRQKLAGIARAESVTIDAHKQLCLPIGVSAVLLRDPHASEAIEMEANYILRNDSADLGKASIEGSRPGRALFLHAALHLFGSAGYEILIDDSIDKAQLMARLIAEARAFELLMEPETNIVLYRSIPARWQSCGERADWTIRDNLEINRFNAELQRLQYEAGRTFVSRTTLTTLPGYRDSSIVCLRAVITNPLTREEDLRAVLEDQAEIAAELDRAAAAAD